MDNIFKKTSTWKCEDQLLPPGWYFWDEASNPHGPYESKTETKSAMDYYSKTFLSLK